MLKIESTSQPVIRAMPAQQATFLLGIQDEMQQVVSWHGPLGQATGRKHDSLYHFESRGQDSYSSEQERLMSPERSQMLPPLELPPLPAVQLVDMPVRQGRANSLSSVASNSSSTSSNSTSLSSQSPPLSPSSVVTAGRPTYGQGETDNKLLIRLSQRRPTKNSKRTRGQGRPYTEQMHFDVVMVDSIESIVAYDVGHCRDAVRYEIDFIRTSDFSSIRHHHHRQHRQHHLNQHHLTRAASSGPASSLHHQQQQPSSIVQTGSKKGSYIVDNRHIAQGLRTIFGVQHFFACQVIRLSTSQPRDEIQTHVPEWHRGIQKWWFPQAQQVQIQKVIGIPMVSDDEFTCRYVKESVCFPRYKDTNKLFLVKGKLTAPVWQYTNFGILEQERLQIDVGDLAPPAPDVEVRVPSSHLRDVIAGRHRRSKQQQLRQIAHYRLQFPPVLESGQHVPLVHSTSSSLADYISPVPSPSNQSSDIELLTYDHCKCCSNAHADHNTSDGPHSLKRIQLGPTPPPVAPGKPTSPPRPPPTPPLKPVGELSTGKWSAPTNMCPLMLLAHAATLVPR